jgi:hypothetical protein
MNGNSGETCRFLQPIGDDVRKPAVYVGFVVAFEAGYFGMY